MDLEVSDHALTRYVERVKHIPRYTIDPAAEEEIRAEIRKVIRDHVHNRTPKSDSDVVLIIDHLNLYAPGRPLLVTVLAGFKRIRWGDLRWHHRVVCVDVSAIKEPA